MRTVVLLLLASGSARAGLYFADGAPPPPRPASIRSDVLQLRAAAAPPAGRLDPDSPRARFEFMVRQLERLQKDGPFAAPDRVNLSAAYLRLGRPGEAVRLLERGDKSDFRALANLATAHFMNGDLDLAARAQSQLLRAWPAVAPGWSVADLARLRAAELAFDRLIRSRADEARRGGKGDLPLDPIFPGFAVETADSEYAPGTLPPGVADRLPANADEVLMQLLVWLPADLRLYWQFGELQAARGQMDLAATILEDLVYSLGQDFKNLRPHRKILLEAAAVMRALRPPQEARLLRSVGLVMTRTSSGPVGAASAFFGPLVLPLEKEEPPAPPVPTLPPPPLPFNLTHILASFAFGFLVAALIGYQMQEWMRRLRERAAGSRQAPDQPRA